MEMAAYVTGPLGGADAPPLTDLIASLEQSSLLARQLPTATDPSHLQQIYASLTTAHRHLSSFLSLHHQLNPIRPPPANEDSDSSAINSNAEPMLVVEDGEDAGEQNFKNCEMVEEVEEKMRDFFIRNKRPKRSVSSSSAAASEQRRILVREGFESRVERFDPNATRLRNLELISQFHC